MICPATEKLHKVSKYGIIGKGKPRLQDKILYYSIKFKYEIVSWTSVEKYL